ncbi:9232_t:CDS:2 [Gigaspora margarita]|uniref:9232_t:CDS:1 n=1 Tax=Gigaspora margarita TaxID=4874 RepID=A0ABN7UVD5_GIGMA|nr:9232_t:CDS:2 [Gigaspora margarita]
MLIQENVKKAQNKQKAYHDQKYQNKTYQIDVSSKLTLSFTGPYYIHGNGSYKLRTISASNNKPQKSEMVLRNESMETGMEIAEIRVMSTETSFINNQREHANLSLLEGSTTNPSTQAMEFYLNPAPEGTLAEKLDAIWSLEGTSQSATAYDKLQNRIRGNKGKEKNKENFQLLVDEAQKVRAQELSEFFNETFAGGAQE